jgi:hypothetical protein
MLEIDLSSLGPFPMGYALPTVRTRLAFDGDDRDVAPQQQAGQLAVAAAAGDSAAAVFSRGSSTFAAPGVFCAPAAMSAPAAAAAAATTPGSSPAWDGKSSSSHNKAKASSGVSGAGKRMYAVSDRLLTQPAAEVVRQRSAVVAWMYHQSTQQTPGQPYKMVGGPAEVRARFRLDPDISTLSKCPTLLGGNGTWYTTQQMISLRPGAGPVVAAAAAAAAGEREAGPHSTAAAAAAGAPGERASS